MAAAAGPGAARRNPPTALSRCSSARTAGRSPARGSKRAGGCARPAGRVASPEPCCSCGGRGAAWMPARVSGAGVGLRRRKSGGTGPCVNAVNPGPVCSSASRPAWRSPLIRRSAAAASSVLRRRRSRSGARRVPAWCSRWLAASTTGSKAARYCSVERRRSPWPSWARRSWSSASMRSPTLRGPPTATRLSAQTTGLGRRNRLMRSASPALPSLTSRAARAFRARTNSCGGTCWRAPAASPFALAMVQPSIPAIADLATRVSPPGTAGAAGRRGARKLQGHPTRHLESIRAVLGVWTEGQTTCAVAHCV